MKILTKLSLAGIALCSAATSTFAAIGHPNYDPANYVYRKASTSVFNNRRAQASDRINSLMYEQDSQANRLRGVKPQHTYGPADVMGDLDAPNGETWYYTGKLTYDTIPADYEAGIWYDDLILQAYDFTVYDAKMEVFAHIKDKMRYEEGEVRVPYIDMAPIVTQKFYNTDDYYEVVVGMSTNVGVGVVREHSYVYSLNSDNKDEEGNDIPVAHSYSFIGDVLTVSNTLGAEQYIITTSDESYSDYEVSSDDEDYDGDPEESPFWQALMSQNMTVKFYTNAVNDTDGPVEIGSKVIPLTKLQGDQMSAPIVLTTTYDGKPYLMVAQYKDSFYNPYASPWDEDVTMREKNTLVVEIFTQEAAGEQLTLFQTTEIPFTLDSTVDKLLASYYSIGNMRYRQDLDFDPTHYNNTSGKAYLIVTKENYIAGSDDSYVSSYYIYKDTGSRYKTIFTDCEGTMALSDIDGYEPQQMFITYTSNYDFHFVNLLSVKEVWSTSNYFDMGEDEESEYLLANLDRTPVDDTYNYVVELRVPTVDENDNDNLRAMWLNADGTLNHIDEVNMGTSVLYAKFYLHSAVLQPGVYSDSDNMAYMCLIKRGLAGSAMQEELLVAEAKCADAPDGKTLLLAEPNEYGIISSVTPVVSNNERQLWIAYLNSDTYQMTLETYSLPLVDNEDEEKKEEEEEEDEENSIVEVGAATQSAAAECYDLQGRRVANPTRGLYIINGQKVVK